MNHSPHLSSRSSNCVASYVTLPAQGRYGQEEHARIGKENNVPAIREAYYDSYQKKNETVTKPKINFSYQNNHNEDYGKQGL